MTFFLSASSSSLYQSAPFLIFIYSLDNIIKVQCVFAQEPVASALLRGPQNTPGIFSPARRAAINGFLSKNPRPQRRKIIRFCKAAGRRNTGRISRTTTQQNPIISPMRRIVLRLYCLCAFALISVKLSKISP